MGCDIVMGNVAPLMKRIQELEKRNYNLEAYIQILEDTYLKNPLDKSENYVHYEVRDSDLVEGEGPMGYYGDV